MELDVQGFPVFATTGGAAHDTARPLIVFLHGAGMDHSVFALQSRWFAHHGWRVLAVDLPGHGRSGGAPLASVRGLADWTAELIASQGGRAALVGHSMGALIALAAAARRPEQILAIGLVGVAEKMPVHPDLLKAAKAGHHDAVDMVAIWGLGGPATRGGSPSPGQWMLGGALRLIEQAPLGALHADLSACTVYGSASEDADKVACPAALVLGERDMMTPVKSGLALAAHIAGAKATVLPGAGHMMTVERPTETLAALIEALKPAG
jgi:pimeloyl-ACP methyl ester carboxylesterase